MTIKILDEETINKIAAGEIIERPASVVKELLENSADSGADRIEVDFEGGGKTYIKVKDNGSGISIDELPLALERHATSKIQNIDDLTGIKTFGFRGEALASLAAVSDLTIHTSPPVPARPMPMGTSFISDDAMLTEKNAASIGMVRPGTGVGAKIHSRAGKIQGVEPAAPVGGTEVTVKDLFSNVPARYKFLKSESAETTALKKTLKSFALSHPSIAVTLKQNRQVIEHWPIQDFNKRAMGILKLQESDTIYINTVEGSFKLEAVLAIPEKSLSTQQGIWIFVQGRHVIDRAIQHAVFEGYRNLIMQHQYPQAVISLSVDPNTIDVNVHPTKAQVKFTDPSSVFRFVSHSIRQALEEKFSKAETVPPVGSMENYYHSQSPDVQSSLIQDAVTQYNRRVLVSPPKEREPYQSYEIPTVPRPSSGHWSSLQLIGQFANTYLITQSHETLVMVDQHAAHERVLFERFKKNHEGMKAERQIQLMEELIELSPEAVESLMRPEMLKVFEEVGFEISQRGLSTIGISTKPILLLDVSLKPLFERLGEQAQEMGSKSALSDLTGDIFASMACHGAIRAGKVLSQEEMQALLAQMDDYSFSSFCPHGRPVSVKFSLYEIEKLFKRIV